MVNTHFATSGALSAKLGETHTEAKFAVGQVASGNNGSKWMYVYSSGAVAQYDAVSVQASGTAASLTNAAARLRPTVGIAQNAFATAEYGWVALEGQNLRVNTAAAVEAGVGLWTTSTAGALDDTANTTAGAQIVGLVLVASAASASHHACIARNLVVIDDVAV